MDARENARRIIHFGHPARVMTGLPAYEVRYFGVNHESLDGYGHDSPVGTRWKDIWGTGWHKEMAGVMGFPREHPLAEPGALRSYRWPDPDDERLCAQIYRMAEANPRGDTFLAAPPPRHPVGKGLHAGRHGKPDGVFPHRARVRARSAAPHHGLSAGHGAALSQTGRRAGAPGR